MWTSYIVLPKDVISTTYSESVIHIDFSWPRARCSDDIVGLNPAHSCACGICSCRESPLGYMSQVWPATRLNNSTTATWAGAGSRYEQHQCSWAPQSAPCLNVNVSHLGKKIMDSWITQDLCKYLYIFLMYLCGIMWSS